MFSVSGQIYSEEERENEKKLEKNGNTASGSSGVSHAIIVEKPGGCSKATEAETQCSKGISAAGEKDYLKSQSSNTGDSVKKCALEVFCSESRIRG